MRLTDDELREVLARAEEIDRMARAGEDWNAEVSAVVRAAEEVGFSRGSVERALSEHGTLPVAPPTPGTLAWASTPDGKSYVAEVVSTSDTGAKVHFLRGSDHDVAFDHLLPLSLLPGERVVVDWPWWGPWTCTVISYDQAQKVVKLSDGSGSTKTFSLADIWLAPRKTAASKARSRAYGILLGAGLAVGAAIGSAVTAILLR